MPLKKLVGAALCLVTLIGAANAQAPVGRLHADWEGLLQRYVSRGMVDYRAMKKDSHPLDAYLSLLGKTDPASLSANGQLAYWINAYNAFTVKLILNHYPLKSIRDVKDPWKQKTWKAGGRVLSLDQIEHEILRKQFKEPRIHFAIVCASVGCPDLWEHAFSEKGIHKELENAARRFIRASEHVKAKQEQALFGRRKSILYVSRIFSWFAEDFTAGGKKRVVDFVAEYASEEVKEVIHSAGGKLTVRYLKYDWDLNEKKP